MLDKDNQHESCIFDIEKKIHASLKKILLSPIIFKEAKQQDKGDMLHLKYKPINSEYKPGQMKMHHRKQQVENASNVIDDLPKPQVVLFPHDKIQNSWQEIRRIGPGLANLGNTCFLNSVLQVLSYTPPLANYILSGYHKANCKSVGFCMQCELTNHINKTVKNHPNMGAIRPMSIIQKLQCIGKNFRFGRQEDAHEFLRFVVEALQKSDYAGKPKLDKMSKETTVANAIFGGYYRSQVKCSKCKHDSNTYDPIMDVNLDIKECSSILQALQRTIKPDHLDGENKYFCERCRTKTVAVKRGSIHREPNILTLQLKRFDFSKMFGGKISKEVHFPEELNIRPYMNCNKGPPVLYKLYAVLVHSGYSCNSGHYYCYVKAANGTWYEMNDNRVTQVGVKTVLNAQAYLLFYVKKDVKKHQDNNSSEQVSNINNNTSKVYGPQKPPHLMREIPINLIKNSGINKTASSISTSTVTSTSLSSVGVPVKRKSEPKINIHINSKNLLSKSSNHPTILAYIEKKKSANRSSKKQEDSGITPSSPSTKPHSPVKSPRKDEDRKSSTAPLLNSLQKLSVSYGETESPESSVPSSPSDRLPPPLPLSNTSPLVDENSSIQSSRNPVVEREKFKKAGLVKNSTDNGNINDTVSNDNNSTRDHKSNYGIKIKMTSSKYKNRNSIWVPVTKGVLHPRLVFNRNGSSSSNGSRSSDGELRITPVEEEHSKKHFQSSSSATASSPSNEEKTQQRVFGPAMPPTFPSLKRKRKDSLTSGTDRSSEFTSQITTLNAHVEQKDRHSSLSERQHVEWNISVNSTTCDQEKLQHIKKKAKKNKKKKKHKHRRNSDDDDNEIGKYENITRVDDEVYKAPTTLKRKLDEYVGEKSPSYGSPAKKKKKKKRNDRMEENPEQHIDYSGRKKKKKKKKHRRHSTDSESFEHPSSTNKSDVAHDEHKHSSLNESRHDYSSCSPQHLGNSQHTLSSSNVISVSKGGNNIGNLKIKTIGIETPSFLTSQNRQSDSTSIILTSSSKKSKKKKKHKHRTSSESSDDKHSINIRKTNKEMSRKSDKNILFEKSAVKVTSETSANCPLPSESNHQRTEKSDGEIVERMGNHTLSSDNFDDCNHRSLASCMDKKSNDRRHSLPAKTSLQEHSKNAQIKKTVPVHHWDDERKKKVAWDGKIQSKAVEHLLRGGPKVKSWDGEDNTDLYSLKNNSQGEREQDEWDEEYDAGKTKKVRSKTKVSDEQLRYHSQFNSFQDLQNVRNYEKDNNATFRPRKHKHGRHGDNFRQYRKRDKVTNNR